MGAYLFYFRYLELLCVDECIDVWMHSKSPTLWLEQLAQSRVIQHFLYPQYYAFTLQDDPIFGNPTHISKDRTFDPAEAFHVYPHVRAPPELHMRSCAHYLCALGSLLLAYVVPSSLCLCSTFCNCAPPFPMCLLSSNDIDMCSVSVSCRQELASLHLCAMPKALKTALWLCIHSSVSPIYISSQHCVTSSSIRHNTRFNSKTVHSRTAGFNFNLVALNEPSSMDCQSTPRPSDIREAPK
ncbi:hypothetical protein F4604DRAFT_466028 [Suillus subluteus]|nr:hypothetical protein F4604DRAFT_466028 [Suillus subluteus]